MRLPRLRAEALQRAGTSLPGTFFCPANRDRWYLAIVKHLVQARGGRGWVNSQLEKGSTFYFTLPKRSEPIPL